MTATGWAERRFPAMGCAAQVIVVGGRNGLAEEAQAQIEDYEARWSRFRPGSELSRCNTANGRPTVVTAPTMTAVRRAVEGWHRTGGRFDPTILPSLEAMGYDRTFDQVASSVHPPAGAAPAPGCAGIEIDEAAGTVRLPPGVRLDLGGIGKGLAADVVAAQMLDQGASGACVNLGGDMRVTGEAPSAAGWAVSVEDPYDLTRDVARARVGDAGIATTSRTYRSWERAGRQVHHLVDPATGATAWTDLAAVTVVAATAWWAEVLAKAAFLAGPAEGAEQILAAGASGVLIDDGGFVHPLAGCPWEVLEPCWR
jgi:thiamine biosynthesis lipoprotein